MAEPSGGSVAHALTDGLARVASAPAVFAGTAAISALTLLSPSVWLIGLGPVPFDTVRALAGSMPVEGAWSGPVTSFLLWSFLCGGILDRYARNRPTRGRGFFGACGAHVFALARLGAIALGLYAIIFWLGYLAAEVPYSGVVMLLPMGAISLAVTVARVRLVVEDRRSAIGALLAGIRFVRRNAAASVLVFVFYTLLVAAVAWLSFPVLAAGHTTGPVWAVPLLVAFAVLEWAFVLALYASTTSLFQARLAHASYTAGPPLEWPESPAAEAITNLSSSSIP